MLAAKVGFVYLFMCCTQECMYINKCLLSVNVLTQLKDQPSFNTDQFPSAWEWVCIKNGECFVVFELQAILLWKAVL